MPFAPSLREKLLLWCDRHCCLCKKACDAFIEIHHIDPEARSNDNTEDNAIPLCFDCHARVSHYDNSQPRGSKFRPEELKKRREQVYEKYTRDLVPALVYRVMQANRALPDVGFTVRHPGGAPAVKVTVSLTPYVGEAAAGDTSVLRPMYSGEARWNLNPGEGVGGHFEFPSASRDALRVGVELTIHDMYERAHALLPVTYVYDSQGREWWLDPVPVEDSIANEKTHRALVTGQESPA